MQTLLSRVKMPWRGTQPERKLFHNGLGEAVMFKLSVTALTFVGCSAVNVFAQEVHRDAAHSAFDMIARTPWTPLSLVALFMLIAGYLLHTRMTKFAEKNKELVEKQAELEASETAKRAMAREAQLIEMKTEYRKGDDKLEARIDEVRKTTDGLIKSHESHLMEHKDYTRTLDSTLSDLNVRIITIEKNIIEKHKFENLSEKVNTIDKNITEIITILRLTNPSVYSNLEKDQKSAR